MSIVDVKQTVSRLTRALINSVLFGATDLDRGEAKALQSSRHDVLIKTELVLVTMLTLSAPFIAFVAAGCHYAVDVDGCKREKFPFNFNVIVKTLIALFAVDDDVSTLPALSLSRIFSLS